MKSDNNAELDLIGLLDMGLVELNDDARTRVLSWATSWTISKAESPTNRRMAAFRLITSVLDTLNESDRQALFLAIVETNEKRPTPRLLALSRP